MNKFFDKIIKNRKIILSIFLFAVIGIFAVVNVSKAADLGQALINLGKFAVGTPILIPLGTVAALLTLLTGWISTMIIGALTTVAQYNQFISEKPITDAWVIIRDLCNMFFILILLVIAFGTILRIESYNAKKLLPKLLIMAILINFSKMIFGLVIDFSQVIMLTFVNAWGPDSGFVILTKMRDFFNTNAGKILTGDKEFNLLETVAGMILGILFMIISCVVLVVLLATLVMRIVMIWIYVILSPFVFLGAAFTPIQKYTSRIWEDFIKQVISGPVLAFFIWLSLMSVDGLGKSVTAGKDQCLALPAIGCMESLIPFIISIGMLIGGLMVAQQIGGIAGNIAGKGMAWAKRAPMLVGAGTLGAMAWGARKVKSSEGRFGGVELNPMNVYRGIKEGFAEKKRKEIAEGEAKSAQALRQGGKMGLFKGLGASKDMTEAMARGWFGVKGVRMATETVKAGSAREKIKENLGKISDLQQEMQHESTGELRKQEIDIKIKEIEKDNDKISKSIHVPYTFQADQGRNKMVREAMSKIGDNDNAEDLVAMWNHAKLTGDKEMAAAVFLSAAKNGHSNEIIMAEKDKDGKTYKTDQDGLNGFVKDQLVGALKMSEQEAIGYQSQFSTICKGVGHYNFAESVGSSGGMLVQKSRIDQERDSRGEARKVDPERYTRDRNRFGYGYEEINEEGKRVFKFNQLGLMTVQENAGRILKEIEIGRFNKNAAMKMTDDLETLEAYIKEMYGEDAYNTEDKSASVITGYTKDKDTGEEIPVYTSYKELVKRIGDYGNQVKKSEELTSNQKAEDVINKRNKKENIS